MSVHKNDRDDSTVQFLETAFNLRVFTINSCKKSAKRDTFLISNKISDMSYDILRLVKSGNSIFPTNAYEARMRRDCFMEAYQICQSMVSELNVWAEVSPDMRKFLPEWSKYLYDELKLIKGVIKSDNKRYSKLGGRDIKELSESDRLNTLEDLIMRDDVEAVVAEHRNVRAITFSPAETTIKRNAEAEAAKKAEKEARSIPKKSKEQVEAERFEKLQSDISKAFEEDKNTPPIELELI